MENKRESPDFIEALARGLEVIRSFDASCRQQSLSEIALRCELPRPTVRRILITLEELGYVEQVEGRFSLTPRTLSLGMAAISSSGLWDMAYPHLKRLVEKTHESSSMAQLDGVDIVYVARVAVPKIIALRVDIGTKFPAPITSQGKVLLADLSDDALDEVLSTESRCDVVSWDRSSSLKIKEELSLVRSRGWAIADEELAPGVRSIAVPVRDLRGRVRAAMNITVNAAETPIATLTDEYLPFLLKAASDVSADWSAWQSRPIAMMD
ncbi:MAG: helix-turn-helix domain-containing protein [Actinomycetota bacterium]|nr:helix-turn-helix domain-containing protein [Actinomycetota bacterium]